MGDVGEEVQTEGGQFLFHTYLLVQLEVAPPYPVEMIGNEGDDAKVDEPGPPGVVPGVVDGDGEHALFAPLVVLVQRT